MWMFIAAVLAAVTPHDARVARGRYLANGIGRCFYCHSPLDQGNPASPRPETFASGDVLDEKAPINAPNLTPDRATGLGTWTDTEVIRAIREGLGRDGRTLGTHPASYYSVMTDDDALAIVDYLRSLTPIRRALARSAPPHDEHETVQARTHPARKSDLVTPVQRGAYLVQLGECAGCHTPADANGNPVRKLFFGGGRRFKVENGYGMEVENDPTYKSAAPAPAGQGLIVASANLTPDASGIPYYSEATFIQTIRTGRVAGVRQLTAAMPWIFFRSLTDADLRDIFAYLRTLAPVRHNVSNTDPPTFCRICGRRHGLGDVNRP